MVAKEPIPRQSYGLDPEDPANREIFARASGDAVLLKHEIRLRLFDMAKATGTIAPLQYDKLATQTLHESDSRREELGLPPIPDISSHRQ